MTEISREYLSNIQWGRIIAKAWLDEDFKEKLESDPRSAIDYAVRHYEEFSDFRYNRIFEVDPPPSPLDGYSTETIVDVSQGKRAALYLPMGTCS